MLACRSLSLQPAPLDAARASLHCTVLPESLVGGAGQGYFLMHCHIIPHEDQGCAMKAQIVAQPCVPNPLHMHMHMHVRNLPFFSTVCDGGAVLHVACLRVVPSPICLCTVTCTPAQVQMYICGRSFIMLASFPVASVQTHRRARTITRTPALSSSADAMQDPPGGLGPHSF